MALSEERINYIRRQAEQIAQNKDVSKLVQAMRKQNHISSASLLTVFGMGMVTHGGGFFYLYKYLWGFVTMIIGYVITYFFLKTCVCSMLAYTLEHDWPLVGRFLEPGSVEQNWPLVKGLLIAEVAFRTVTACIATFITPHSRREAQCWLDSVPRETSSEALALLAKIGRREA
jgi:hypothetical protein